jgi:negative regulator of flagellin synthesis FlgM
MKVNNTKTNSTTNASLAKTGSGEGAKKSKSTSESMDSEMIKGASQVAVSAQARDINKAKELARPSDDIDEAKVARLQKMIDGGTYSINSEAIADKMVDEHFLMPS